MNINMKRSLSLVLLLTAALICRSQTVSFTKNAFKAGETVTAIVSGDLLGVENGITKTSYASVAGTLNLGIPAEPGFYRLDFKFSKNVTRSYLVGVIAAADNTAEQYNINLTSGQMPDIKTGLAEKLMLYFKKETNTANLLAVCKSGLAKFCKENAVSLVSNVSFCLTTVSGVPVMATICQSLSASNAKKLGIEVMKSLVADMRLKNYINENEYKLLVRVIDASQLGALLKSNCSLVFKGLKALSDNNDIKIALGYFEQQCKTTVLIIEKYKALP